jgi:septum formation protein
MTLHNLTELSQRYQLILASGSPRRVELLTKAGIQFRQLIPKIEEIRRENELPEIYARRLAQEKALAIAKQITENGIISLGCDTIVVLDGSVLEKPTSKDHAFAMLSRLSGKTHVVISAAAFAIGSAIRAEGCDMTEVTFNTLKPEDIHTYIDSGEPMDKAGAYGIQGMGAFLVDSVRGDIDTVVGLPLRCLDRLAGEILQQRE